MADDHLLIFRQNAGSAPASIPIPPLQDIHLEIATATFNGTGAAGSFQPCCSVYAQDGTLQSRTTGRTVSAGDSAEITFLPSLGEDLDAIHFGYNVGDFLSIITQGTNGILLEADGGFLFLRSDQAVLIQAPFIGLDPENVNGTLAANVRLGRPGTGSTFTVDHVGIGFPMINVDADAESIEFNLNQTLSHLQVINALGDVFSVFGDGSTVAHLRTAATSAFVISDSSNNALVTVQETGDMTFSLGASGAAYTFTDNLGNPIFQIDADGSLHGLTGQTLTFDL